jgi:hypothetical protein
MNSRVRQKGVIAIARGLQCYYSSAAGASMRRKPSLDKIRARVTAMVERLPEGRFSINCRAPTFLASQLQSLVPTQFHMPKYTASKGWIGLWLDVPDVDWGQVEVCLVEAYRMVAPKRLLASL